MVQMKKMNNMISDEKYLIILASRKTMNEKIKNEIREIVEKDIDWELVLKYSYRNKVTALVFYNIENVAGENIIPNYLKKLLSDYRYCNVLRNNTKLEELKKIVSILEQKNVKVLPVKGAYMIDNIYCDRSVRITNDMDVLIRKKDISIIEKTMENLGYTNGFYNTDAGDIELPSSVKRMLYKTKMYNLIPFTKIVDREMGNVVTLDFSFAMDFNLDTTPVEELINQSKMVHGIWRCAPELYFIHMCCHHYREASHVAWFKIGSDLNLIKFCDVRELVLQKMDEKAKENAIEFAKKYGLEKTIYFTLYYLKAIYNDGYEDELMKKLNIENNDFIFEYSDGRETMKRKKEFWNSFFDENNKDEITQESKYEELMV